MNSPTQITTTTAFMSFSHNGVVSKEICIQIKTTTTSALHVTKVAGWIARVVSQLFPVVDCMYPHMVVAGTLDSDWRDTETGKLENTLLVAVHESSSEMPGSFFHNSTYDGMVVTSEAKNTTPVLSADAIMNALQRDSELPPEITALGVSGVSERYMQEVWSEIISKDRNWMDGKGGGWMVHSMFMWSKDSGVHHIREMSFNFGWDNHNE